MPSLNQTSLSGLPDLPSVEILELGANYRPCHIVLPDTNERTAAIALAGEYYSFFRVEKSEARTQAICARLMQRGHRPIVTKVPKGFAVWTLEPNAQLASQTSTGLPNRAPRRLINQQSPDSQTGGSTSKSATGESVSGNSTPPYRILVSPDQYQFCNIRVPDLDKRLMAISVEGLYYSLFKTIEDVQQAIQVVKKLNYLGNETIITKNARGYSLWVLEPDAYAD